MIDYHVHSRYSCDCQSEIPAICKASLARGLSEVAICDHAEFAPHDDCYGYLSPCEYVADVERCRQEYAGRLTVRTGIELGEPGSFGDAVSRFLAAHEFDIVLGSLHFVDGVPTFSRQFFRDCSLDAGVRRYFAALAEHASCGDYDVLAHFDVICRAAYRAFGSGILDYVPYETEVRRVLSALVDRGIGIEINTATTYRRMGTLAPARQVLAWYREMGGAIVTVGSDAHSTRAVGAKAEEAIEVARAAGFSRLATFERRRIRWIQV